MKKRLTCIILAAALAASIVIPAFAAPSLDNFVMSRSYNDEFTDVPSGAWFYEHVRDMYRYGLVTGRTPTTFVPHGNMTNAEIITLACRMHDMYFGYDDVYEAFGDWFAPYVSHAEHYGIIYPNQFEGRFSQPATRADVAFILGNTIPESELLPINRLKSNIPDRNGSGSIFGYTGYEQIRLLYAAGVLTGSDPLFSFNGSSNISRSEVMAIACRIIDPGKRVSFSMAAETPLQALVSGFWRNYGVTQGTSGIYRFSVDGTYIAYYESGIRSTGTYTLVDGILNISGWDVRNLRYDATFAMFGRNIQATVQGENVTITALTPTTRQDYEALADNHSRMLRR